MSDHKKEFYDRLEDVRAGMLGLESDGKLMPMSPNFDDDKPGAIWFLSAAGQHLVDHTSDGAKAAKFVVADGGTGLYADITGTLEVTENPAKVDEIWSPIAAAWYEEDKQDPDLRLLKFTPQSAEVWLTSTSGLKFFYEIMKANITDEMPDAGTQVSLTF
ncbi:pyridoxamine 5'-phosphate oxidase family protein [Yoonia sp. 208BN28-4]|uniref:pyridoxamine 5'-phosphate oxidase family protein n=1 Tax=Yoonia sp. 208BN28-4 TaxID=3126505 RepID=UPI003099841E